MKKTLPIYSGITLVMGMLLGIISTSVFLPAPPALHAAGQFAAACRGDLALVPDSQSPERLTLVEGETNVEVFRFLARAGIEEDILISRLTLKYEGTVARDQIKLVRLVDNAGRDVGAPVALINEQNGAVFSRPFTLPAGQTSSLRLMVNLGDSAAIRGTPLANFSFSLADGNAVAAQGAVSGQPITAFVPLVLRSAASVVGRTFISVEANPWFGPAGEQILRGRRLVPLFSFITAVGIEPVKLHSILLHTHVAAGQFERGYLIQGNSADVVAGPVAPDAQGNFLFQTERPLRDVQPFTFLADISPRAQNGLRFAASIDSPQDISAEGERTGRRLEATTPRRWPVMGEIFTIVDQVRN